MILDLAVDSYIDTKIQTTTEKIDELSFIKIKNFCFYQGTLSPTYRIGERLGNHVSGKGLVSRIWKECFLLNNKANNPTENTQRP